MAGEKTKRLKGPLESSDFPDAKLVLIYRSRKKDVHNFKMTSSAVRICLFFGIGLFATVGAFSINDLPNEIPNGGKLWVVLVAGWLKVMCTKMFTFMNLFFFLGSRGKSVKSHSFEICYKF